MPELPEVETIRRGLVTAIVNVPITKVDVRLPKIVPSGARELQIALESAQFTDVQRRGKLLMLPLSDGQRWLLLHLKMTGQLIYQPADPTAQNIVGGHPWPSFGQQLPHQYTHVVIDFADQSRLFFNDQRQFGYMKLVDTNEKNQVLTHYGVEPLDAEFTLERLHSLLGRRQAKLKAVLLNQEIISGLGNIYADEICFFAGVMPDRRVIDLTDSEIAQLYVGTKQIIARAIELRGTTVDDYRDTAGQSGNYARELKVYKQTGKTCQRCGQGVIAKKVVAGRGTHWCPVCQK